MIRSMTGFARSEKLAEWGSLVWELRAVNHRYLETHFRLPEEFRPLESKCRSLVAARIKRGKVECGLRFRGVGLDQAGLEIDRGVVRQLVDGARQIATELDAVRPISPMEFLRWPGVVKEPELDLAPVHEAALALLQTALDELVGARGREGERIQQVLLEKCASLEELVQTVRVHLPELMQRLRDKLLARIAALDLEVDQNRVEQELVMQAQKMDVDEELDRLCIHVQEVQAILVRSGPAGRRLDFLMQEFNREANTLGSKSQGSATTRAAMDMKVLIEQMREQVQNVE